MVHCARYTCIIHAIVSQTMVVHGGMFGPVVLLFLAASGAVWYTLVWTSVECYCDCFTQTAIDIEGKSPLAVCLECRENKWSQTAKLLREAYAKTVSYLTIQQTCSSDHDTSSMNIFCCRPHNNRVPSRLPSFPHLIDPCTLLTTAKPQHPSHYHWG